MKGLRVHNLTKSFGSHTVISGISFEVPEGEFCILLGPSGCGKTTVLRLIAGLEEQDGGKIFIGSREVSSLSPRERDVAMVFQSYALYPHLNVFENMAFSLRIQKNPRGFIEEKVRYAARLLDIEQFLERKPRELSGGQRQRVAIGRAIVRNPQLFLFDEPLSNLDAQLRASMRIELANLHRKLGSTIIYVTHDQVEAMTLGQKIILFNEGSIQQDGTPNELYEKPANVFVASFIGSPSINLLNGKLEERGGSIVFECGDIRIAPANQGFERQYIGRDVTLGIRPEALHPGPGPVRGTLEITEHIGPETILYVNAGGIRFTAKAPPSFRAHRGDTVSLTLNSDNIHFFYRGSRIHPGE